MDHSDVVFSKGTGADDGHARFRRF